MQTQGEFKGKGFELLIFLLIRVILVIVTLGIYALFFGSAYRRWIYSHTHFGELELEYKSDLGDFIIFTLINMILLGLTFGLALPWVIARQTKYVQQHSQLSDGRKFDFSGNGLQVIGLTIISALGLMFTLGLASPWIISMWSNWKWNNTTIIGDTGDSKFQFEGEGVKLAGVFIVNWLLTLITFGLYSPWAWASVLRWEFSNLKITDAA
jgi:uncharacterized membrane protein YjgN (DUF898 family)